MYKIIIITTITHTRRARRKQIEAGGEQLGQQGVGRSTYIQSLGEKLEA
jgi:hypothetical protein